MAAAREEVELKARIDGEALAGLWRALADAGPDGAAGRRPPKPERLRAIYFDTRDHRLWTAGLSLRVRQEGGGWIQTLKMGRSVRLGLASPLEASWPVATPRPDLGRVAEEPMRDALVRALGTRRLRAVFETVVERRTRTLQVPLAGGPAARVEVALDHGQVQTPVGEDMIAEVEIELKEGPPPAILAAAETVLGEVPFRLGTESKAERGYRRLAGAPVKTLRETVDPDAFPGDLVPHTSARAAFTAIGAAYGAAALVFKEQIPDDADPEGPHQLRVFLRRLRTLLKAFRPALDGPRMRRLSAEARDLARVAGQLRDADVIATEIVPADADGVAGADAAALADLRARLEEDRARIRREVAGGVASARWSWLTLQLALFPLAVERAALEGEARGDGPTFGEVARGALKRSWKACNAWGRRIDELTVEERHELRKELKGLRYTIEIVRTVFPEEEVAVFLKQLKKMQDVFGYLNDVETARQILTGPHREGLGPAGEAARAVVAFHGSRAEKAWPNARGRWKALKATPRFWETAPAEPVREPAQ